VLPAQTLMFSQRRNTIGDEPKAGSSLLTSSVLGMHSTHPGRADSSRGEKIPDQMIKTLPDYRWDAAGRKDFHDSFVQMIKCIRGQFLMRNEMRANPESLAVVSEKTTDTQGLFSPRRDRIIGRLGTTRDAVKPRHGVVSPYLSGDKRQAQGGVQGMHLSRPENPFDTSTRSKTEVMPQHASRVEHT
jgi:hypothetical protein